MLVLQDYQDLYIQDHGNPVSTKHNKWRDNDKYIFDFEYNYKHDKN